MRAKETSLIIILLIFYTVGTFGILSPTYRDSFLPLSAFNLILSFGVVLLARKKDIIGFLAYLALAFVVGMTAEWIGIHTGYLFGNYSYGQNLGTKFLGVPLVIGLNWGMLVTISGSLANRLAASFLVKVTVAALLMTGLDYLMEPVAIESDFWQWKTGQIPIYNYICWFVISFALQVVYFKFKLAESNKVNDVLFVIMVLFFSILTIF
jgi:putative membrane protein